MPYLRQWRKNCKNRNLMKKAICWHSGFMRMIIQRRKSSIDFLHSSLNAARGDEPISPPSLASYAWHNSTHCGGVVAFSMMQTSDRELPLSMWYSSSARMKASGVTTFSSACLERMLPSSRVTWKEKIGVESDGFDGRIIIAWYFQLLLNDYFGTDHRVIHTTCAY